MQPVRKGKILPRGSVETVKYFACGRNIGQLETKLGKDQGNYVHAVSILFVMRLPTNVRFGRYCDQRFALA